MLDCFPCFKKSEEEDVDQNINNNNNNNNVPVALPVSLGVPTPQPTGSQNYDANKVDDVDSSDIEARGFTFRELATATKNFRRECLLGECASGRIYKGTLPNNGEVVSVKRMDRIHGNKEFLVEVHMLSILRHSNLLNLVGYCADGDQRLLVYEFMPKGSVEGHLFDLDAEKKSLDWATRMKIACGTAQGIEYLHTKAKPPVIYRDLKCSNIMLDDEFNPKLSDYGLAKVGASNMSHMTVMGSEGYSAPEYQKHGELTLKSDVYSFGVVLLELISGRRALDTSKPADEQHLVAWAQPFFRNPKRFPEMADPRLNNSYPVKSLNQVVGVAAMCLQDEPDVRPLISDVVASLGFLDTALPEEPVPKTEMETIPDDHPAWPPEIKARSSMESDHDETDHSEESSEASMSDDEESFDKNRYERKDDFMNEHSDPDLESESSGSSSDDEEKSEQKKQNSTKYSSSFGCINSLEYDVASMSSSSSISDNESPHGHTNKKSNDHKFQGGNSSSRMKCKSTKTPKEGRREGLTTGSRRSSRKRGSSLSWKGTNDMVAENENIGSYSRKSSNVGSENGSVFEKNRSMSSNSTKSSNEETDNGAVFERNLSISSNSSQSSIGGSEDGSERSGHHKDNEGLEDELL